MYYPHLFPILCVTVIIYVILHGVKHSKHSLVLFIYFALEQGCQTHFHQGPHQTRDCLQRAEIILGLYKCNYSLTVKE